MSTAIIIPARLESTRLPLKLLLAETGLPLICHTARRAVEIRDRSHGAFQEVVVAADAEPLVEAVEQFSRREKIGVRAVMTRTDHQSGSDRIAEVAAGMPASVDAVLNLQGDEPEVPVDAVLGLGEFFRAKRPDVATLVYPVTDKAERANPALVKAVLGRDGRALYFSRADIPFRRDEGVNQASYGHVGIYLYSRSALEKFVSLPQGILEQTEKLEQLRALENGMTIAALVMDRKPPKGIDTPEDYAEFVKKSAKVIGK